MKLLMTLAVLSVVGVFLLKINGAFDTNNPQMSSTGSSEYNGQYEKLLRLQKHHNPHSPEGIRVAEQIQKIERRRAGHVKQDEPDEFARLHFQIRTRYGESGPAYPPNYKLNELKKALQNKRSGVTLPWVERGPGNVTGRTRGLIVDPSDPGGNTWFAGSVGGGIWKTNDGGQTWDNKTPNLPNLATTSLAFAPSNPDVMYAGTGEGFFNADAINGDGIFKSTNHGETWEQLSSTAGDVNFQIVNRIVVDPANENNLLACCSAGFVNPFGSRPSGIWKSTNGGASWYSVYNEPNQYPIQQIIANPHNFNTLYAGVFSVGVLKSTDAGETWFNSSNGISGIGRIELAIAPGDTNRIYGSAQRSPSALYHSPNGGNSWILTSEQGTEPNWLGSQGWYDNTIAVHPFDPDIVFVGGINIWKIQMISPTQRQTTQLTNWLGGFPTLPYVHVDHHNLMMLPVAAPNNFKILNANDGGIGYSDDGGVNWTHIVGYQSTQFYGADKMPGGDAYIGGMQDNGTWRSPEGSGVGTPWIPQLGGDGLEVSWHFNNSDKLICTVQYNLIWRSLDGGQTWNSAMTGLTDVGPNLGCFITKIAKTNQDPDLLFTVGASGVWKSTNFGSNWSLSPISTLWGFNSGNTEVKISEANPDIIWAGARMDPSGRVHVSTDGGQTFALTNLYTGANQGWLSGLATHPAEDSTAYVLFSIAGAPHALRTTDLGQTWEDISGFGSGSVSTNGFPDVATYCLQVMPHDPDILWAGTEIGLFESTDNGANWYYANNGLPAASIWEMKVVDDQIVVATHGRGVWSVNIPELATAGFYPPLLRRLYQGPDGFVSIDIQLRSLYDSTTVSVNGMPYARLSPNTMALQDTVIKYPILQADSVTVLVTSYKEANAYSSVTRAINAVPFMSAHGAYSNNFNSPSNDFTGIGYSIQTVTGFSDGAIHTAHPYSNNLNITYTLTIPIIVASSDAYFAYDDVAIIEPGEPGSVFGDFEFWDYVVVEGTTDGITWTPLKDGYDARFDPDWLNAYNNNTPGSSSLYRHHELNLLNVFSPGENVLLRFRLYSDAFATGWGWAIDNLEIQDRIVGIGGKDRLQLTYSLMQSYPNPFNPTTTIAYQVPRQSEVRIEIYNNLGQRVRTLINAREEPGTYQTVWDGRNDSGAQVGSGVYLYRMIAGEFVQTRKMILMK